MARVSAWRFKSSARIMAVLTVVDLGQPPETPVSLQRVSSEVSQRVYRVCESLP